MGLRSTLAAFGIEPTRVRRVTVGRPAPLGNENWHVWTRAGERVVLRRHGYGRTAEEIEYETRVLHHAAAAGWRVPVPLGAPVTDGDRFVSVCTYVPGTSHRIENAAQLRERGALLACLHHDLRPLAPRIGQRPGWHPMHDLETSLQALRWEDGVAVLGQQRPDLARPLRAGTEFVERQLDAVSARALPVSVIHGDFTRWNVRFRGGRLTGVLDFDLTHLDTRAADLAMARAARSPELLDAYRAESARLGWPLDPDEERVLPGLDGALMIGIVAWELYGQLVAGVMDIELVERQVRKLRTATLGGAPRKGKDR
ncbi:MAG: phosphotransferase [Chloroflexi bacterium]|nr:phosphotransferase [Chloroflexota bacterium]